MTRSDDERWPGRPAPLPDESLASWFARLAGANGLRPGDLFSIVQPGGWRYPRDLDRFVDEILIDRLAAATGTSMEAIRHATFQRWVGTLYESDDGLNKLPWLPPAGWENSRRSFGQQICPCCIEEDPRPYLRLTWRLAFLVACPKHRCLLVDRCPGCGEPVNILRRGRTDGIECWSCGKDLRMSKGDPVGSGTLGRQDGMLAILHEGWAELGEAGMVHALGYFHLLSLVFRLLSSGRHALPLRTWVATRSRRFSSCAPIPRVREVEILNPRARGDVLNMAGYLLEDWPHRFVEGCRAVRLTSRHLIKPERSYPFAYQHAVDWHLTSRHRAVEADELETAKRYLRIRGIKPTYRALVELTGVKFTAERAMAEPAAETAPWGGGRYWKVDGITPEVKAAVRKAAHRTGESVGVWLERLLRRELDLRA